MFIQPRSDMSAPTHELTNYVRVTFDIVQSTPDRGLLWPGKNLSLNQAFD